MSTLSFPILCSNKSPDWLFWSTNAIWNTPNPDLTLCFQYTILNWIPLIFLTVSSAIYIPILVKKKSIYYSKRGKFNIIKSILICGLFFIFCLDLFKSISDQTAGQKPPVAQFLQPILSALFSLLVIYINRLTYIKGVHSSGILFIYWSLQLVVNTIILYSKSIRFKTPTNDKFRFNTSIVEFVIIFISFLANCFADPDVIKQTLIRNTSDDVNETHLLLPNNINDDKTAEYPVCPEIKASFLSKITFSWPTNLIYRGFRKPLKMDDLYMLKDEDLCKEVVPIIDREWDREVDRVHRKIIEKQYLKLESTSSNRYQSLSSDNLENNTGKIKANKDTPTPWFLRVLLHTISYKFFFSGFLKIIYEQSNFIQPAILGYYITFIGNNKDYIWHGFFYMFCIFLVSMTRTFINQQFMFMCSVTGLRAKTAIISIIYKKALKLSLASRKERTVGEIVNLMSVDASKFQDFPFFFHLLWVSPITIIVTMYFLWQELGPATIAGLVLLICMLPINAVIGSKVKKLQTNINYTTHILIEKWICAGNYESGLSHIFLVLRYLKIQQMRMKDGRMKIISEILSGIKILKLFAWELSLEKKVKTIREKECKILRKAMFLNAFTSVAWFCTPPLVALFSFAAYVLADPNNILTPQKAFVSISLFNILNFPMSMLPGAIIFTIQGLVSAKRINHFLNGDEFDPNNVEVAASKDKPISVVNGNFSWGENETPILKDINLEIDEGSLVMIVGTVGSGKSSLISAILGEMFKISGTVKRKEPVAYVPQQAWCQNRSLQDNILFGKPMINSKYHKVLEACALTEDLNILPAGDQTEIGEKGINLSGGQKQRISLARSVYQESSVYLFDDPLSAVDAHVGKHIFEKVLYVVLEEVILSVFSSTGLLSKSTRVLVTHGLAYLPKADKIFVIKDGKISESGTYKVLLKNDGPFAEFIRTYLEQDDDESSEDSTEESKQIKQELRKKLSITESFGKGESKSRRNSSISGLSKKRSMKTAEEKTNNDNKKLIDEEVAKIGGVKLEVFIYYIKCGSYLFATLAILCYCSYLAALVSGNIVLSSWSEVKTINNSQDLAARDYFLGIYGGLGFAQAIFILIQSLSLAYGMFLASKTLHNVMLRSIIRAPNSFFDTTPSGRILNRIGKDIDTVDVTIPNTIRIWLTSGSRVISSIIIICIASPYFILALIPLSFLYFMIQKFYICTSRQLQRIDSIRKSPIYSHFQESIIGTSSIRAYKVTDKFIAKCEELTDQSQMVFYLIISCNRWMQFYLELIGNIIILLSGVFAVFMRDTIGTGLAGLSVSYALTITTSLAVMVRNSCDIESNVVAIERIKEYTEIESEAPWDIPNAKPPNEWPQSGKIEFRNFSVRYRPGLDLALRNLNFTVQRGEKLGIVGRTGAGKSSLALALFRLIEPAEGTIKIDDLDISSVGLHDLRSKLTIIPQDPVLFSGNLRINLDPFNLYSDGEIWIALEIAHLKSFFAQTDLGLDYSISENGENLSVGQRQLVCLARALLKRTSILVLDEATAAVDMETDELIQNSIRTAFKSCTVLTIAHRLNTILDYDRVMVLQQGQIKEINTPKKLLADEKSLFYSMAKDAGLT